MKETAIQNQVRLDLSDAGVLNFRNNTGALKDKKGRLVRFGLFVGSSDVIGITPVKITQDMVGQTIGVFTAIETKKPKHKTAKKRLEDQANFIESVKKHGGRAGFANSSEQALDICYPGKCQSPP